MKILIVPLVAAVTSSFAFAGSFDCTAKMETRSMILRDGGAGAKKSAMIFKEGAWETHCPFTRGKIENKTTKGVRQITVSYKKAGSCTPHPLPGKTERSALNLVVEVKAGVMTASLDDPRLNAGAPCELAGFSIKSLGLRK